MSIFEVSKRLMRSQFIIVAALLGFGAVTLAPPTFADTTKARAGAYDDVLQDLKDAIVNRGFVIDYVGHIGKMLDRTSDVVGSKSPYLHAHYMHFCSAKLSHSMAEADPENLAACPYIVFTYEEHAKPGQVVVGYRKPPEGASDASKAALGKVEALLAEVVDEVASGSF
ncbi:MAG: DUF302 domain-containing protein [Pseudomonadota bacterium]